MVNMCSVFGSTKTDSLSYYLERSKAFYELRDYKNVHHELSKSLTYQKVNNKSYNLGEEYLLLGRNYKRLSVLDTAMIYLDLALEILAPETKKNEIAEVYLEKGRIYRRTAEYPKSFQSFQQSLKLFEILKDTAKMGSVKLNIGNVFNEIRRFNYAIPYYNETIAIYKKLGKENGLSGCYNNLGNIYLYKEHYDSALFYLNKALVIRIEKKELFQIGYTYQNLTSLYIQQKKLDLALVNINKALEIHIKNPNSYELHLDYYFVGEIYKDSKAYVKAYKYYKMTYDWAVKNKMYQLLPEVSMSIGVSLFDQGKTKASAYYFNQHKLYKDTFNIDEQEIEKDFIYYEVVKDSMLKKQLVLQKEISEIENSNLELQNTIETNNNRYLWLFIVFGLLSISLVLMSFRKRLRQAKEHQSISEARNEELKRTLISKEEKETLLKEVHHRVKNNLQIINSLIRLQSHYTSSENYQSRMNETENRIRSMALVHEKLYNSDDISKLDAKKYIEDLSKNILESFQPSSKIKFIINMPKLSLSIDTLIPLGLIINEIVSNSIKYGFNTQPEGIIRIELQNDCKNFSISDNGVGTKLSYQELSENSLGMELIETLCDQLDGELKFDGSNGFRYSFIFNELT